MERASSSACSSSSGSSSALFDGWFPSNLKGEPMNLSIRGLTYHAHVKVVDQEEPLWSTVHFKTAKKSPTRFSVGDLAKLESRNRRCWSGDVTVIEDDVTQLWTILQIRVPSARESKFLLKSANNVLVMVNPVGNLSGFSSRNELRDSTKDPSKESEAKRIRVGINGFSQVGRILVEMGLQSIDVQVVAINDPSITLDHMVKIWKSTNIGIAKKDHQTLVFEKRYYKKDKSVKEGEKIKINVLLEQMEVTVFREQNQVPWEQVNADFVVEYSVKVDAQISDKNENWNSCLRCLPMEIISFGLHVDEAISRLHFSTDNRESAKRAATFSIVTRSTVAAKAVCNVFKEWDEQPTSLLFHANAVVDRPVHVDDSSVDLKVTLEKAEGCSGTNSIATRFCADDMDGAHRLRGIFSWCVDIVRCVPVGGCRLELV
ncbi:hypothetical protein SETIT_5G082000v2 [Setaria italica]|uniref:Glyceraldehyde 3-phosphate dehydrogenase NAD(P) binding domain-containing protein n=1 Tax=Setaria italica TaxID=4555 RepID=A0A368R4D2_SETIT|nr:hypothetical protein SETIT_5G082000v2 [Setaria italica]